MSKWILTIVGVATLGVLCDVIIPDGSTKKYIRTVFGVVVSLAVVKYVGTLAQGIGNARQTVSVQTEFVANLRQRQNDERERLLTEVCVRSGVDGKASVNEEKKIVRFVSEKELCNELRETVKRCVSGVLGEGYVTEFMHSEELSENEQDTESG